MGDNHVLCTDAVILASFVLKPGILVQLNFKQKQRNSIVIIECNLHNIVLNDTKQFNILSF